MRTRSETTLAYRVIAPNFLLLQKDYVLLLLRYYKQTRNSSYAFVFEAKSKSLSHPEHRSVHVKALKKDEGK
jgi:hypothetical protein